MSTVLNEYIYDDDDDDDEDAIMQHLRCSLLYAYA